MAETKEDKKVTRAPVSAARFSLFEQVNQSWRVTAEVGTTLEEIQKPDYWSFIAASLRPWDMIGVAAEDGTWYADVMVVRCSRVAAVVDVKFHRDYSETPAKDIEGYKIQHRGPHKKWSVVKTDTKQVLVEGLETEAEAMSHLANHLKK